MAILGFGSAIGQFLWRQAPDAAAALVLLGSSLIFFAPALLTGQLHVEDDSRFFYVPFLRRVGQVLRQGELPLWIRDVFGGYPLFADGEVGMLYPLHLLLLPFLPTEQAVLWLRVIRFTLAGIFAYAYLRTLRAGRFGSLVSGVAYMLCGFAAGQLVHTNISEGMAWLPLVLTFLERSATAAALPRYRFAAFAGVALAMQGLAVHIQVVVLTAAFGALYLAYRIAWNSGGALTPYWAHPRWAAPLRLVGRGLLLTTLGSVWGVVGLGLAAVQLLPLYELSRFSLRSYGLDLSNAAINSLPREHLVTLVFPHLFKDAQNRY